ncbi:molybdate ABC transporter substrate-binding protein [Bordetella genomosp. 10]|uniref:molybdate ABC transporter substrate-binding protein n=1 Tax=Bordetella genomosp. 10 TaxID=1416804 RepID=UPI00211AEE8E|nr:molybdate ABC transporter substrate-binding protein [Bordetella genomosp. 10]
MSRAAWGHFLPRRRFAGGLLVLAALLAGAPVQAADGVLIAAMGGYRKPVLELVAAFHKETGLEAQAAFGHIKQIETQARQNPDVAFLIGDRNLLEPTGLFSRFDRIGTGRLVLVASKGKPLAGVDDLKGPAFARIALPHRVRTVFGAAADACMKHLGLDGALAPKLLEVDSVPQVGGYIASGEVDAGFVNKTEALAIADRAGPSLEMPQSCYAPIELALGTVKGHTLTAAESRFEQFLQGDVARGIMDANGL